MSALTMLSNTFNFLVLHDKVAPPFSGDANSWDRTTAKLACVYDALAIKKQETILLVPRTKYLFPM